MKKLSILFLLMTGIITFSCSDDDDAAAAAADAVDDTPTVTSLDLTSDSIEGLLGDTFTFTVDASLSDGTTVDVTSSSDFTINDELISNPFTPAEVGVFTVTSTFSGASDELDITVTEPLPPTTYLDFNFDDGDLSAWTLIDNDGDGFNWAALQLIDMNGVSVGTPVLRSASWSNVPLTPDNFAVSPAIDLTDEDGSRMITLNWDVTAADAGFADENYSVYAATENTVAGLTSSAINFNELVSDNGPGGLENIYSKTLDLTALAGSVVYVAFRHHDVTDQFTVEIDNVTVIAGSDSGRTSNNNQFISDNIDGVLLKKDLQK